MKTKSRKEVLGQEKPIDLDIIIKQFQMVQGKVLTIVEASIVNKDQLKAIKDLINTSFSNQMQYVFQLSYPETRMLTEDEAESTLENLGEEKGDVEIK